MFHKLQNKLSKKELVYLLTMLAFMFSSGLTLEQGLSVILSDSDTKFNKYVPSLILQELRNGMSLWEIFRDNEEYIGKGLWQQLEAAEKSGKVAKCMERLAEQLKNDQGTASKIRSAIAYPAFLVLTMLGAGYFMFTTVVPQIADTYAQLDAELPSMTKVAIGFANFLIDYKLLIVMFLGVFIAVFIYLIKKPLRLQWHSLLLKLPLFGNIITMLNYSLIYTILCDMIETGGSTVDSINVSSNSCKNERIKQDLAEAVGRCISNGYDLADTLADAETMPKMDRLMLKVGQQTGHVVELLQDIAVRSKQQCDDIVNSLLEIINPLVMLFAGGLVGVLVISIYLPLLSLSSAVG